MWILTYDVVLRRLWYDVIMGNVIKFDVLAPIYDRVFALDGAHSAIVVYRERRTGSVEIVQMNNDNEAIRTIMSPNDARELFAAFQRIIS